MNSKIIALLNNPYTCTIKKLATATRSQEDYDYIINYYKEKNSITSIDIYFNSLDLIYYIKAINKYKTKKKFVDISIYNYYCELLKQHDVNRNKEYINSIIHLNN